MKRVLVFYFLGLFLALFIVVYPVLAAPLLSLIPPSGELTRGTDVEFTINIDTQGETINSIPIGVRYDPQILEYRSIALGNTFTTVTPSTPAGGDFTLTASHPTGFTGQGTVAKVTFRIIADAPGSTQLCSIYVSSSQTPTPLPTTPPPANPTLPPITQLPQAGSIDNSLSAIGIVILIVGAVVFFLPRRIISFFLFFIIAIFYLIVTPVSVYAEEEYYKNLDITPIPCMRIGGCPTEILNNIGTLQNAYPNDYCTSSFDDFKKDPEHAHYWIEDPKITAQGKADERARQFIYWVITTSAIDNHPAIRSVWMLSSSIAYVFVAVVAAVFGVGYIVSRKTNLQFGIEIRPTLIKIGAMLLYIALSYAILLFLIQMSEILMKFFIENLGGNQLFNIYFTSSQSTETSYKEFIGCRDLNIRVQEGIEAELFMLKLTNVTYYVMGSMILLRKILLWFLIIVAPFLAILMPFILIRNTGWIWIGVFFQWLFYGPLLALFLGATAKIWGDQIPFNFDFSRINQAAGYIYPTAIMIVYGGPAQVLAVSGHQIGAFNNANYVDTFAEYVISLIMLWAVTFFPWWLLRIFRDYCCEGIYATRNILLAMYDQMRGGPPSKPEGPLPTLPTLEAKLKAPQQTEVRVNVSLANLQDIRNTQTTEIFKSLNLSASKLTDIARFEMNKELKQQVNYHLTLLANPLKAQTPRERQQYMNLRTELFSRAIKSDAHAQGLLSATSTSRFEQQRQKKELLKQIPTGVSLSNYVAVKVNIPAERVKNITTSYIETISSQESIVKTIATTTKLPSSQVQQILNTYTQNIHQPPNQLLRTIVNQTAAPPEKVREVLRLVGNYSLQSTILQQTADQEKIQKEHIDQILQALSATQQAQQTITQIITAITQLPPQKTQTVVKTLFNTLFTDTAAISRLEETTLVPSTFIKEALEIYSESINLPPADAIEKIGQTTNIEKDKVREIINQTISYLQSSEIVHEVVEHNNYNLETVKEVVEHLGKVITLPNTKPPKSVIERTSELSHLEPIQVQAIATSMIESVIKHSDLTEEISKTTGVETNKVTTILQSYITNISQPVESIISTIATQNNIDATTVNNVLEETNNVIKQSRTVRNVARREQVSTHDVHNVMETILKANDEQITTSTPLNTIAKETHLTKETVNQQLTTLINSTISQDSLIQTISNETKVAPQQIKQIMASYTQNISQPTTSLINNLAQTTNLPVSQISHVINSFTNTVVNNQQLISQIAKQTQSSETKVRRLVQAIPVSLTPPSTTTLTAQPVINLIAANTRIPEEKVQSVTNTITNSIIKNQSLINELQAQTGLQPQQIKNILTTYTQNINSPADVIIQRIHESAGIEKDKVRETLQKIIEIIHNSYDVLKEVIQKEGVDEDDVIRVISNQIPLATEPDQHIEQTITIPPTISLEDYEEVKNMWVKQYEDGEVPVTENIQSREQWLDQDIVFMTNILNKLLSPDENLRQEGLDELGFIIPLFIINNLKGDELLVYLKAKLEAAKQVLRELLREKRIKQQIAKEQEKEEELVELKPKKKEAPKALTLEEEEEKDENAAVDKADKKLKSNEKTTNPIDATDDILKD